MSALASPEPGDDPTTSPGSGLLAEYSAGPSASSLGLLDLSALRGHTEARRFTPPLRPLTRETSLGYELADFADLVLGQPLLEWQRWVAIHALELLPDGHLRFRTIVLLVARQNGKSHLSRVLTLYFLYMRGARTVLGAAQSRDIARTLWSEACELAKGCPDLADELIDVRLANGQEALQIGDPATGKISGEYRITATTRSAGRGLSVDLLLADEIREWRANNGGPEAWSALSKTTMARRDGQIWAISNAGDVASVVLNQLTDAGHEGRDESIGVFEYSAADDRAIDDVVGWQEANPALGVTISAAAIRSAMATDPPGAFRTEVLCQRVEALASAIDLGAWGSCLDPAGSVRSLCAEYAIAFDVAPDGEHCTLAVAGVQRDGRARVEAVDAWATLDEALVALPDLVTRIKPLAAAWYPSGPAAERASDIRRAFRSLGDDYVFEIKGQTVTESCMELAGLVKARRILQPGDPLLDAHAANSRKLSSGDGWRFVRKGGGHVDAMYALAGAIYALNHAPEPPTAIVAAAV